MTKEEFDKCNDIDELLNLKSSDRKLRLLAVACCRSIQHLMRDDISIKAVDAAELFADNLITQWQLKTARDAVWDIVNVALDDTAWDAWRCAALAATWDAALDAAASAARYVTRNAATAVARNAIASNPISTNWSIRAKDDAAWSAERAKQVSFFKDIINPYANPIDPTILSWKDQTLVKMAQQAYNDKDFSVMPILADALEEAGCQDPEILSHCRSNQQHMKGCWVVDLILGKG